MSERTAGEFFLRCRDDELFRRKLNTHTGYDSFKSAVNAAGYAFSQADARMALANFIQYAATEDEKEDFDSLQAWYTMQTAYEVSAAACAGCSLKSSCAGSCR